MATRSDIESTLQASVRGRRIRRVLWVLVPVLLAAAVAGGVAWRNANNTDPLFDYETVTAERGDMEIMVAATGTVEPIGRVNVRAEVAGVVRSVEVDYNDPVSVGQVLARIDPTALKAQRARTAASVDNARASLAGTEITLRERETELNRTAGLARIGTVTQAAVDTAQAAYDRAIASRGSAQAQLDISRADLAMIDADIGKAEIRAPMDGVVLERQVEPGQAVGPQSGDLITIAQDLAQMNVLIDIDEADVTAVQAGQIAMLVVDALPNEELPAEVRQVRLVPTNDDGVVTYTAVLSVDNPGGVLRPGMSVTAEIVVQRIADALVVPNTSLRFDPKVARNLVAAFRAGGPELPEVEDLEPGMRRVWALVEGELQPFTVEPLAFAASMTQVRGAGLAEGMALVTAVTPAD